MKQKRVIALCMAAVLAAGVFTGCGKKTANAEEVQKTEDGKVQIDFWYSGGKTAVNVLGDMIEEFNGSQDT